MSSQDHHVPSELEQTESKQSIWRNLWNNNKGALLILISEALGTCMDAIVRFLQQGQHRMHPLQGPLRTRQHKVFIAKLQTDAVHYLPLAEATIFRFLVPIPTALMCYLLLGPTSGATFTRKEFFAGVIALIGVVIVAHPASIFGKVDDQINASITKAGEVDKVSSAQRILALIVMALGTLGTIGAYTCIRVIGNRAHALISVNYFALLAMVGSIIALLAIPGIGFSLPASPRDWVLLLLLGIMGFSLQFLLTAGLTLDKSSKATSMIYAQIVFALICDWAIWRVIPGRWSFVGGAIVIASTLWAALQKPRLAEKGVTGEESQRVDEESALLGAQTQGTEEVVRR